MEAIKFVTQLFFATEEEVQKKLLIKAKKSMRNIHMLFNLDKFANEEDDTHD